MFSYPAAALHYYGSHAGLVQIPSCIVSAPGGLFKSLHSIWFTRFLRRIVSVSVRSPLRQQMFHLIDITLPDERMGYVIATCHTPWIRLLTHWCLKHQFALIVGNKVWVKRSKGGIKMGKGFIEMPHLVKHLQSGGRIVTMATAFNDSKNFPASFLGMERKVSLLPARLAKIAGVPLISMITQLRDDGIHIENGPKFECITNNTDAKKTMMCLLDFFEGEIKKTPSIWSTFG